MGSKYTHETLAGMTPVAKVALFRRRVNHTPPVNDSGPRYARDDDPRQPMRVIANRFRLDGYDRATDAHHGAVMVDVLPLRTEYGELVGLVAWSHVATHKAESALWPVGTVLVLGDLDAAILADDADVTARVERGPVWGTPAAVPVDREAWGGGCQSCDPLPS